MDNELTLPDIPVNETYDAEPNSSSSIVNQVSRLSLEGSTVQNKKNLSISNPEENNSSVLSVSDFEIGNSSPSNESQVSDQNLEKSDSEDEDSIISETPRDSFHESFVIKKKKKFVISDSEENDSTTEEFITSKIVDSSPANESQVSNRDLEKSDSEDENSIIGETPKDSFCEGIVIKNKTKLVIPESEENDTTTEEITSKIVVSSSANESYVVSYSDLMKSESEDENSIISETPKESFNKSFEIKKKKKFVISDSEENHSTSEEISQLKVRSDLFEKNDSPIIITSSTDSETSLRSEHGCEEIVEINSEGDADPYLNKFILGRHGSSDSEIILSEGAGNYEKRPLPPPQISPPKHFKEKTTQALVASRPITCARQDEWNAELIRLNALKDEAMEKYNHLKIAQSSPSVKKLPDGGLKLFKSLRDSEKKVIEFSERVAFLKKKIKSTPVEIQREEMHQKESDIVLFQADVSRSLPTADFNVNDLGKKAMQTFQTQSSLTEEALKRLHSSLETATVIDEEGETPKGFKVQLLPHQKKGLLWMTKREGQKYPSGGILADDMGLGKTLSLIALIIQNKPLPNDDEDDDDSDNVYENQNHKYVKGGTLVIAPASVLSQWETEIRSRVAPGTLNYVLHHGAKRDVRPSKLARYDVVLTTYSIMQKENKENDHGPLLKINWHRIILDEAHTIRNAKSLTAKSIFLLKGSRRWCLTGTPIQNKEADLFALIRFLKCRPFDDLNVWKRWVNIRDAAGQHRLNCIMKSIMLRRTKEEIKSLNLKEKNFSVVKIKLDEEEYAIYERITLFSRALFAKFLTQKADKEYGGMPTININNKDKNPFENHPELNELYLKMNRITDVTTVQILVLLLRLRQLCCHPSLIVKMLDNEELRDSEVVDNEGNDLDMIDRMMRMSIAPSDNEERACSLNNLSSSNPVFSPTRVSSKIRTVMSHLEEVLKTDDKVLIVSQFTSVLEIIQSLIKEKKIKYAFLSGKTPVIERGPMIDNFNNNPKGAKIMLLSLQAGGTGLNLVGANHILFVDIHWNPQLERQAFDRIYRIGQQKNVYIYKFICEETIEEYILKLQENKLAIADGVLTGSKNIPSSKLSLNDLKMLFNVGVNK